MVALFTGDTQSFSVLKHRLLQVSKPAQQPHKGGAVFLGQFIVFVKACTAASDVLFPIKQKYIQLPPFEASPCTAFAYALIPEAFIHDADAQVFIDGAVYTTDIVIAQQVPG